jgi:hypothetical protein
MHNRLALILLIATALLPLSVSGQKKVNSPFSRYNLGDLEPAGSFRMIGMGGTGTALRDNSSIYFNNPASYSSIDTNSFIFDFGVDYGLNIISDGSSHHQSGDLNFDHLMMGFPVGKRFGVATGFYNMSNIYYKITETVNKGDPDYDPIAGAYASSHNGSGGLTNFFLGSGIDITKYISAGVNMTLLFGNLLRTTELDFADLYNVYHNNLTEKHQLAGIHFDYGVQLNAPLKKDYFLNAGASFSAGSYYKSRFESFSSRFTAYGGTDTLEYFADSTSKAHLPGTLRAGLAIGQKNKFVVGIDYISTKWTNARFHGSENYLGDTRTLLFGAEYIPEKFSNYSFLKRMEYRIGGHIGNNYLVLDGIQVKEYGMSCGLGIPMRILSKTNLFFDFTRKSYEGTSFSHYENYFTMGISLNLYDLWFIKRKYD